MSNDERATFEAFRAWARDQPEFHTWDAFNLAEAAFDAGFERGQARAAIAQQPDTEEWQGVVYTLIGTAMNERMAGKVDMPAWLLGLAEKIARVHIDEAHAQQVREVAAKGFTTGGAAIAQQPAQAEIDRLRMEIDSIKRRCGPHLPGALAQAIVEKCKSALQGAAIAQPAEPAPEQVSDSPFDQAIHQYAQAAWHHDMAGMRKGYMALQGLCSPSPAQADAQPAPTKPVQVWCDTCEGTGAVHQESQHGVIGSGGDFPCPDCDGKGFYVKHFAAAPPARQPQWMPIETAPKDGSLFLCWVSARRWSSPDGNDSSHEHDVSQVDFCSWRDGPPDLPGHGYFDPCCGQIGDSQDVTHWMPLPPTPGGIGREGE